jgi:PAS domain S-box-containing protein
LPTGDIRWVLGQATAQKSESGKIIGYVGTVTDITEQKMSEQLLEAHEARLVEAQRIGNIGFWERDIESETVLWSDELYRIFGIKREQGELAPGEIFNLFHPEDQERVRESFRRSLSTGIPFDTEHRIIRPDGEERWLHVKAEITRDASGSPKFLFGTTQDITENRHMQAALRQSEDRFQMSFDVGGAGMFIADSGGNFVRVNKSFCSLLGYTEEELLSKSSMDVSHSDDAAQMPKLYRKVAYGSLKGIAAKSGLSIKMGMWFGRLSLARPFAIHLKKNLTFLSTSRTSQIEN